MKKFNKISTKIKFIGGILVILMLSVIMTIIYLNQQNAKDALVVNIVGKQRMLTQKISKIFFTYTTLQIRIFLNLTPLLLNLLKH